MCGREVPNCGQRHPIRRIRGSLDLTWSHLVTLGLTGSLLDSLETMCFAGVLRTSGTIPTGGTASPKKKDRWQKINSKHIRTHQNLYRRHQRGPTISQKHFSNHFVNIHLHQPQRARPRARSRSTILTPDPSLRITCAGTIKISRSDSPPNLRLKKIKIRRFWGFPT